VPVVARRWGAWEIVSQGGGEKRWGGRPEGTKKMIWFFPPPPKGPFGMAQGWGDQGFPTKGTNLWVGQGREQINTGASHRVSGMGHTSLLGAGGFFGWGDKVPHKGGPDSP